MSDDDYTPSATPLAMEIHERFCLKMAPGGHIDRILNGAEAIEKRQPETDEEIALRKKQIEIQLVEYAEAMVNAELWWGDWKVKKPKGFRRAIPSSKR